MQSVLGNSLECLLDVDGLLCGRLKVGDIALGLAPGHCAFLGDLPLILLHIDLVAQYDEGEVLGVPGAGLNEELVPPTVQGLERLGAVDVVNEDAAVCAAVERDTEGLESLLTSSIPQLHRNQPVVDHDFFCQEVGSDSRLVLVAEPLVYVLVHERGLSDTTVAQNNNLEENAAHG